MAQIKILEKKLKESEQRLTTILAERQQTEAAEYEQRLLAEALGRVGLALNAILDLPDLLDLICRESATFFKVKAAYVWLVQGDELVGFAGHGVAREEFIGLRLPLSDPSTLGPRVTHEKRPIFVNEAAKSDQINQKLRQLLQIKAILGVPLIKGDKTVGALMISDTEQAHRFGPGDIKTATVLGNYAAIAIENAYLLEAEREQRELAEALREVGAVLSATLDFNAVLDRLLDQVARVAPYDTGNVFLVEGGFAHVVRTHGYEQFSPELASAAATLSFDLAQTPNMRWMVETGQSLIISNTAIEPTWLKGEAWAHVRSWAGAPISGQGQVIAFFSLDKLEPGFYQPKHAERLAVFAGQAGLALENARLYTEVRRRLEEQNALREAGTIISSTLELEIVLSRVAEQMGQIINATSAYIYSLEPETMVSTLLAEYFSPAAHAQEIVSELGSTYNLSHEFPEINAALQAGRSSLFHRNDPELSETMRAYMQRYGVQTMLDIPLIVGGQIIALAELWDSRQRYFTPEEIALCQDIAQRAAVSIQNAQLFQAAHTARQLSNSLREIGASLVATLDPNEVVNLVLDSLGKVVAYDSASVMLKEGNAFRVKAGRGLPVDSPIWSQPFTFAESDLDYELYRNKKALIISDVHEDPRWISLEGDEYIRSWLAMPMLVRDKVIGILNLDKSQPGFYTEEHVAIVSAFVQQAAIALENARLFNETHRQTQQLAILNELAGKMTGLLEMQELCTTVVESVHSAFDYLNVAIFTVDLTTRQLVLQVNQGVYADRVEPGKYRQAFGAGLIGQAAEKGEMLIVNNTQKHPDFFELEGLNIRSELVIPLKIGQQVVGVLNLDSDRLNAFDESDVAALTTVADQLAVAMEKTRLFAETQQWAEQLEALRQVSQDLIALRDLDTLLRQMAEQAIQLLNAEGGTVYLYRPEQQVLELVIALGESVGSVGTTLSPGEGVTGRVWVMGEPLIVNDYQQWGGKALRWANFPTVAVMGVPIQWGAEALGVLNIFTFNPKRYFTPEDATLLAQFATQAAIAIQNVHLYEQAQRHTTELEAVRHITLSLTASLDLVVVLDTILEGAFKLLAGVKYAHIFLYEAEHGRLNFGAALGTEDKRRPFANPRPAGITYTVAQRGELIVVPDLQTHPLYADAPPDWSGAVISLPLKISERVVGVMNISYPQPHLIPESELNLLHLLGDQAAIAIENAHLYEQAQRHAAELKMRVAERTFELQALYELTQALGQATQLGDIIRLILLHLYQAIPYDVAASLLVTDSTGTLVIQSQRPISPDLEGHIQKIMSIVLKQPLADATLEVRRIQSKTETVTRPPLEDLASIMQVPIVVDKTSLGLLLVGTERPDQFNQEQLHLLRTVADQAAESIRRLQLLLAAEHQRLESLVVHLPDGVVLLDADRHIVLANPVAQKFLAVLTQATTGDKLTYLGGHPIERVLNPDSTGLPQEVELPGYLRQVFEITAKPMAVGPEAGGWTLVIRDVTEDRAAQERIQQQDRLVAVGQLAAGIAHDFNNILTSIIGFAELARIHPDIPQEVGEDLQRIIHQGQRAARLIRQILDFSRQSIAEKRPIDLVAFLKETIKLLERTIPEDIRIILEIEPGNYEAYILNADPTQITQVLTNLAVNARDAMPAGGLLQFRLSIFILNPGERPPYPEMSPGYWIALSISDTGAGIVPEVLPRIFEPFFTTKEVGKGTGLGLAQVYGIITQHEGYIDVKTQLEKGTTFTLYLPAAVPLSKTLSQTIEAETTHGHGEVILLVEDDSDVLEVTQAMLEHLGYRVVTATNGRHALEIYDQHWAEIALVLTDVTMPEMGGVVLSQTLQAKYPAIKVVALTGYPLEAESKDLLAQGIVDWLQKPLNRHQLGQTISRSLKLEAKSRVRSEG